MPFDVEINSPNYYKKKEQVKVVVEKPAVVVEVKKPAVVEVKKKKWG